MATLYPLNAEVGYGTFDENTSQGMHLSDATRIVGLPCFCIIVNV